MNQMIIKPAKMYTLEDLFMWLSTANSLNMELIIDPCNPNDPKILQTKATIKDINDIGKLTQWLGGIDL